MIDDENENPQGITAYHGSPHEFDRFDTSKIGTGEGAQAYGHGLYFAKSEPVAKGYRDKLAMGQSTLDKKPMNEVASEKYKLPYGTSPTIEHDIADIVSSYGDTARSVMEARHPQLLNHYDKLVKEGRIKQPGHMYEVAIDAHPDHFLDWDKPLSEQSEHVRNAFDFQKDLVHSNPYLETFFNNNSNGQSTGAQIYKELSNKNAVGLGEKGASDFLQRTGIHGIRYLDAGSRNALDDPTHNYVVFDHNRVKVKRRYERGGEVVRTKRSTGGRIPEVDKIFKEAKRNLDGHTKSMLHMHDDAIVNALRIAQGRI